MAGQLDGKAVAITAAGFVLLWSGVANATLKDTLLGLLKGQPPALKSSPETTSSPTVGVSDASSADGSAGSGGSDNATSVGGKTVSPAQAYSALRDAGVPASAAVILTAIGGAESDWNVNALNNDPATGDYSVGVWQINYYGDLLGPRTAEFGSPGQLQGNLAAQALAAATLYKQSGLGNWTTYTRGTYQAYLPQALAAAAGPG